MSGERQTGGLQTAHDSRRTIIWGTAVLLLGLALSVTTTLPSHAAEGEAETRTGRPCIDGWQRQPLPKSARGAIPHEVIAQDGKPTWLLGGSNDGAVAYRWRDGRWRKTAVRTNGAVGFMGGDDASGRPFWTAGYDKSTAGQLSPTVGTIGGGAYSSRTMGNVPSDRFALTDAATSGRRTTVVGLYLEDGRMQAYARANVDGSWRPAADLGLSGQSALTAATITPKGSTWAVGWRQAAAGQWRPLIARQGRNGWTLERGARLPAGQSVLTDVVFPRERSGYAVGYLIPRGQSSHVPIMQSWDGKSWSAVDLPWGADGSAILRSVASGLSGVWVSGTLLPTVDREMQAFVANLVDGTWTVHRLPPDYDGRSDGWSVAATEDGAVAAIETDAGIVAMTTCVMPSPASATAPSPAAADTGDEDAEPAPEISQKSLQGRKPAKARVVRSGVVRLKDVAADVGLGERVDTYGGLVADLDGDGWDDIFYSRHFDVPGVGLGGPDGFSRPADYPFTPVDRHGCAAADIDADDRQDVLCAVGRAKGRVMHRHDLAMAPAYEDGALHLDTAGAEDPFGRGRDITFLDLDGDRYPELFITTAPDRVDGTPGTNRFFRNDAGRLVAAPELGLDRSTGGACAFAADIDRDGDDDLFHCVEYPDDGRIEGMRLYVNERGSLQERSFRQGVRPMLDIAGTLADVDGDRWPDLVQLSSTRLRVSRGSRDGFREVYGQALTKGKALAVGDVDGDGRDDIYVARADRDTNLADVVLLSRPSPGGFSLKPISLPVVGGKADDVVALDHDQNGLADFLVLNGRDGARGPVQLIASYRNRN